MTILRWDKPKKIMTTDQWANHYGFESGPTGGYSPNMSEADQLSWKAKITGTKLGFPQVEIRKTTQWGSQIVIIVNLGDGYNYKYYRAIKEMDESEDQYIAAYGPNGVYDCYETVEEARESYNRQAYPTKGINAHIATNGPIQMDFDELRQMNDAIEEAKAALTALAKSDGR